MTREEMKGRTKAYANRVVKLCSRLPKLPERPAARKSQIVNRQ